MTFEEIGEELGVSAQRAHQIYDGAMARLSKSFTEDEIRHMLQNLVEECPKTLHEAVEENLIYETEEDELGDFWKEENNTGEADAK